MYTCVPVLPCLVILVIIQRTSPTVVLFSHWYAWIIYISCSPVVLVNSFSTYLRSLFLEGRILADIWKTSLLMFNYILHFCGSPLHFLQLSDMVKTPYLALDSNRGIIRNLYNFSIRLRLHIVSGDYNCPYCIKSWISLFCCSSPLPWRLCSQHTLKSISSSLTVYTNKRHAE